MPRHLEAERRMRLHLPNQWASLFQSHQSRRDMSIQLLDCDATGLRVQPALLVATHVSMLDWLFKDVHSVCSRKQLELVFVRSRTRAEAGWWFLSGVHARHHSRSAADSWFVETLLGLSLSELAARPLGGRED